MKYLETKADFDQHLHDNAERLSVIDFIATWCDPCKRIGWVFEEFSQQKEYEEVSFYKIDVDKNDETAVACDIQRMPTFIFYKHGVKLYQFVGDDEQKLKDAIDTYK